MPPEQAEAEDADLLLRPATADDLPALAAVNLRARAAAYPAMPRGIHPAADVRAWVAAWDLTRYDVWLAERDGRPIGYARFDATWLDDLYVDRDAQGRGVGGALLDVVKAQRPEGFSLWVFVSNTPAHDFYLARGLVDAERTDGSGNEERSPDIRMVWRPVRRGAAVAPVED